MIKGFMLAWMLVVLPHQGPSPREEGAPPPLSLERAVRIVLANHPLGRSADAAVARVDYLIRDLRAGLKGPRLNLNLFTGVVPEARGDIFFSPDKSDDLDNFGPFTRISLDLVQPLYSFGQTGAALSAGESRREAEQHQRRQVRESLTLETIRAYCGGAAAARAVELAKETRESYLRFKEEVTQRARDEESEVDDADLFEVQAFAYDIEEVCQASLKLKILAERTLNALLGRDPDRPLILERSFSPFALPDQDLLDGLVEKAEARHPQLCALESAMTALQFRIDLAERRKRPVLFIAASLGLAWAPGREDQTNPFVLDNFNFRRVGAALGLSWDPNFFRHNLQVRMASAEYDGVREKREALRRQIGVAVHQAFAEVESRVALLESARRSMRSARSWLRLAYENWGLGIGETWRMLRAYERYHRLLAKEVEQEFSLQVALAGLARTAGDVNLYLDWKKNGRVAIH